MMPIPSGPRRKKSWKNAIIALTGCCTILIGSSNNCIIATAAPVLIAQQVSSRTPQAIIGRLDQNSAVLEDNVTYYETHQFEGAAGEILSIDLSSDDFDAYLILLNPTGEVIAQDSNRGDDNNAQIIIKLLDNGTYTLIVKSYQAGDYRLNWRTANSTEQVLVQANQLNQKATELYEVGRYAEAILLTEQALAIVEQQLGSDHLSVASNSVLLAFLYKAVGSYSEAELLVQRALEIQEQQLGITHPETAQSLNNLALLYELMGRYDEAELLFQRALNTKEQHFGPEHPSTAISLSNLAGLYESMSRYGEAEILYQRALNVYENQLGGTHYYTITVLNNLALLYELIGRYEEALLILRRTSRITEQTSGPDHPDTAQSLNNLALLHSSIGQYEEAETLYQRALTIREKRLGPEHPDTALTLNNLAALYQLTNRYRDAEKLLQRALTIREQRLGPSHPDTAQSLNNLAHLYQSQGRYEEAEPLFELALTIVEQSLGPDHHATATSLNNLAALYYAQGQFQRTLSYLSQGLAVEEALLSRNIVSGSDANKRDYLATVAGTTDGAISLHLNNLHTNSDAANLALTTLLQRKGRTLDLFTNLRAKLKDDPTALDLFNNLNVASTQLSTLTFDPSVDISSETYQNLQIQIQTLEDQLSRRSPEFSNLTDSPTLDDIQKALPSKTALVEFIRYQPVNPSAPSGERFGPTRYAAYILFPDGTLQGMDLGPAETIDAAISTLLDSLASPETPKFQIKEEAHALDTLVMAPVRQGLGDTTTVFLSPDGAFNLIPFEALVDENNNYLVERYQVRYLTSGRDLMRIDNTIASDNPAILMGDPTFGRTEETSVSQAKDSTRREINLEENVFPPLPGTQLEVEGIAQQFPYAEVYLTTTATEAQLKTAQQPSILHLATHGFFRAIEETLNPLLQSGLVLAGVAERQSGPDENGVLTALEVTSLALRGTQLVVLSACETGLGELSIGEGLYGLRRALVLAGSQSQVMSLWKVDDTATQELMVAYYEKLRAGTPRDQALTQSQREFLQSPEYDHPYYWAAFIASGDWRPLD